jgi:hypothetical protein
MGPFEFQLIATPVTGLPIFEAITVARLSLGIRDPMIFMIIAGTNKPSVIVPKMGPF